MTIHVELENGQSAEFLEPAELTNGQRKAIVIASKAAVLDPIAARELQRAVATNNQERQDELLAAIGLGVDEDRLLQVGDITIATLMVSWTLNRPLPSEKPEVLDEIAAWDYDRLQRVAGELLPQLRWSGGPPKTSRPTKSSARTTKR